MLLLISVSSNDITHHYGFHLKPKQIFLVSKNEKTGKKENVNFHQRVGGDR